MMSFNKHCQNFKIKNTTSIYRHCCFDCCTVEKYSIFFDQLIGRYAKALIVLFDDEIIDNDALKFTVILSFHIESFQPGLKYPQQRPFYSKLF